LSGSVVVVVVVEVSSITVSSEIVSTGVSSAIIS
jgi:hypothetical protein